MSKKVATLADRLCETYLAGVVDLMRTIHEQEKGPMEAAARRMAGQIASDRLIHIFGPGGHSNLASQELFFRAGGLMHINAILDEVTLLSNGALRSMAIERTPGVRQGGDRGSEAWRRRPADTCQCLWHQFRAYRCRFDGA